MIKVGDITRTELHFTSHLYHQARADLSETIKLFRDKLGLEKNIKINDIGFEVCFFRDFAKAGLIKRVGDKGKEKQTFDLAFFLTDGSLIILEAKAHQGFSKKQLEELEKAQRGIPNVVLEGFGFQQITRVYLVGLHSTLYSPNIKTVGSFDALMTWKDVAKAFPNDSECFKRADSIYND